MDNNNYSNNTNNINNNKNNNIDNNNIDNNELFYKVWSNLFLNNLIKRNLKTYQIFETIKINLNESFFQSPYREYVKNLVYEYFIQDDNNNNSNNSNDDTIISQNNRLIKLIPTNIKSLDIIIIYLSDSGNNNNNRNINNNSEIIIIPNSVESIRLVTNYRFLNVKLKLSENLVKLDLSSFQCAVPFEMLLENLRESNKLRVLWLGNQSFKEFSLPVSLIELNCGISKQKYLPSHFPIGLKRLIASKYFNQPLKVNREIYETILKSTFTIDQALPYFNNQKLLPDNLESIVFQNLFNQYIDVSVLPKSLTSLRFSNDSDFNQPLEKKLPVSLTSIKFGSWFNQDLDFELLSNVKVLKLGSSFQRDFSIDGYGLNSKLEKIAFKSSYESNQTISANTFKGLPEGQLKSIHLSSFQTVEPNSIPNGVTSIKNCNWSMIHLLPQSVTKLKYTHDLINIPTISNNNKQHQIPPNIKSLSILGLKESSNNLPSNIQHLQFGGKTNFKKSSITYINNNTIIIIDYNKLPVELKSLILNEDAVLRSLEYSLLPSTLTALSINRIRPPSSLSLNNSNDNLQIDLTPLSNLKLLELGPKFNQRNIDTQWLPPNLSTLVIKNKAIQIESPSTLPVSLIRIFINSQSIIINQFNQHLPILLDKLYVFDINSKDKLKLFKRLLREINK